MENFKEIIFQLESKLQQPDVRKSTEQLKELISDDLIEFGSSGQVYTKKDVLNNLPTSPEIKFKMTDFRINILSSDVIQSQFKTEKTNLETDKKTYSLRSSLWKNEDGEWKMIFHQGTPFTT
jgi:hypothetical protein